MRPLVLIVGCAGWAVASFLAWALVHVGTRPEPTILPPRPRDGWIPQPKPRWPDTTWDTEHWDRAWWKHLPCGAVTAGRPDTCPRCTAKTAHPSGASR